MKTIRGLIQLFRLHKWGFPTIALLGLLMSLTEGVGIGLFISLLNGLVAGAPQSAEGQWIVETMNGLFQAVPPDRRFAVILTCVFVAVLVTALLGSLHSMLFAWLDGNIAHDLRSRIFRQLMTVSFAFVERDRSG